MHNGNRCMVAKPFFRKLVWFRLSVRSYCPYIDIMYRYCLCGSCGCVILDFAKQKTNSLFFYKQKLCWPQRTIWINRSCAQTKVSITASSFSRLVLSQSVNLTKQREWCYMDQCWRMRESESLIAVRQTFARDPSNANEAGWEHYWNVANRTVKRRFMDTVQTWSRLCCYVSR